MTKEEAQKKIREALIKMGCTDIVFEDMDSDSFFAAFNSKEVTSFVTDISGWRYSGIQLNISGERQYKINFKKIS